MVNAVGQPLPPAIVALSAPDCPVRRQVGRSYDRARAGFSRYVDFDAHLI